VRWHPARSLLVECVMLPPSPERCLPYGFERIADPCFAGTGQAQWVCRAVRRVPLAFRDVHAVRRVGRATAGRSAQLIHQFARAAGVLTTTLIPTPAIIALPWFQLRHASHADERVNRGNEAVWRRMTSPAVA